MIRLAAVFFVFFGFAKEAVAQSGDRKPALSKDELTAEQVAVYRAFLRFYAKGSDRVLYVADTTDWLGASDIKEDADCSRSFGQIEFDEPEAERSDHTPA